MLAPMSTRIDLIKRRKWVEKIDLPKNYIKVHCRAVEVTVTLAPGYAYRDTLQKSKTFAMVEDAALGTAGHQVCRLATHVDAACYRDGALWIKRPYRTDWECYAQMSETKAKQFANNEMEVVI